MSDEKNYSGIYSGIWLLCQTALLISNYGFKLEMPWWVTWFPSLLVGIGLILVAIFLLIYFAFK